jgi:AsmA family protein
MNTLGQSAILSGGKMDTDIDVKGAGNSVRQIMAGLNGKFGMQMGSGRINNRFARIVLSDLFQLISTGSADSSNLNCFVTKFDIAKGVATSKALAMDTNGATIHGSGKINLGSEKLDMKLDPSAKQTNLVRLAIPVNVRGTLASPSVTPDPAGLVKGATGALAGTAEGGDTVGALAGLVTGAAGGGTAQPAPASGSGCGAVAAAAPAATTEPAQPAAATTSPTDQLIQQGTEKTKEGVGDALKGLLGD